MMWHGSFRNLYFLEMANVKRQQLQLQCPSLYMQHSPNLPRIKATKAIMSFNAFFMISRPVMSEEKPQLFYRVLLEKLC